MKRVTHDCSKCLQPIAGRPTEIDGVTYHERCAPRRMARGSRGGVYSVARPKINIIYAHNGSRYVHPRQCSTIEEAREVVREMRAKKFKTWAEYVTGEAVIL